MNFALIIAFHLLLFSLFFICNYLPAVTASSTQLLSVNPKENSDICDGINCGQGTCKPSDASPLGFDCECNANWAKAQIPPMVYASCILPNCTINLQCGNGSSPPPRPPPPSPLPRNLSDLVCALKWCGDGSCITNSTGSTSCLCNPGSSNLLNNSALVCLRDCNFGTDCHRLGLGLSGPLAPPTPSKSSSPGTGPLLAPPPPSKSSSPGNGPAPASNCSRNLRALTTMLLAAIILQWS